MDTEPTPLRAARRVAAPPSPPAPTPRPEAFDEAFAAVAETGLRVDGPRRDRRVTTGLAGGLREQLAALESQQRELARLLDRLSE